MIRSELQPDGTMKLPRALRCHAIGDEFLAEELEERGMTGADLARALGIPQNRVSEKLNRKRSIMADTALRLARWMGSTPQYWRNLQRMYDLRIAEERIGDEIRREVVPEAVSGARPWRLRECGSRAARCMLCPM